MKKLIAGFYLLLVAYLLNAQGTTTTQVNTTNVRKTSKVVKVDKTPTTTIKLDPAATAPAQKQTGTVNADGSKGTDTKTPTTNKQGSSSTKDK